MFFTPLYQIAFNFILLIVAGLPYVILQYIRPFQRGFYCSDQSLMYPYVSDTISSEATVAIGVIVNFVLIFLVEACRVFYFEPYCLSREPESKPFFRRYRCPAYIVRIYNFGGYFVFGFVLNASLTSLMKNCVGRLRPYFLDLCQPDTTYRADCQYFVFDPFCTQGDKESLRNARLSFPSGRSSFIWYSMVYAVLYLESQMIWPMASSILKRTIQILCIWVALIVALSRISDFKHHYEDVLAGMLLGGILASLISIYGAGFFRFPSQPIIVDGVVASDVNSLKERLKDR